MKSLTKTLGSNTLVNSLHRGLLRNLVLLGLGIIALVIVAVVYFDERLVRSLSVELIDGSRTATEQELHNFFAPIEQSLHVAVRQIEGAMPDAGMMRDSLFLTLSPFVLAYDRVDGLSVADSKGNAYVLFEEDDTGSGGLLERVTGPDVADEATARWRRWQESALVEEWERRTDYVPSERPWYQAVEGAPVGEARWTAPYTFFTTKEPGITASVRRLRPDTGEQFVAALDVSLVDVARFTMQLNPSEHGKVFVFTEDEQLIGLPADGRFDDGRAFRAALLRRISDLDLPALDDALEAWKGRGRSEEVFRFESGGQTWWAGFSGHEFTHEGRLHVGVLIPESDFLKEIGKQRNLTLSGIVGAGLLIAAILIVSSVRRIRGELKQTVTQIERRLGQYRLKYKIGDGGNGAVFRARHTLLRRPTAIKIMRPEFARSESAKARFEHEVQITAELTHPNTVAIYDFGQTPEGTLYYAMEYLTGLTLDDLVRVTGPLAAERVIYILDQVCGSLSEAHGKGLIHRDIKPANIMLCERGGTYDVVKVLDFGLVKEAGEDDPSATRVDVLVGTPQYMAPEVISAPGMASAASDLYAVGAVGYFLLTGHNVFDGTSTVEICAKHLHDAPVPPSQRLGRPVPADLEAVVLRCLDKRAHARPASAEALAAELRSCADLGRWTPQDARDWWQGNQYALVPGEGSLSHTPLSNTQLLVDMDERLERLRRTAGQTAG